MSHERTAQMSTRATLFYAASEADSNLYYATRFIAPDPFLYVDIKGERLLVMSDLEMDRARHQAKVPADTNRMLATTVASTTSRRKTFGMLPSDCGRCSAGPFFPPHPDVSGTTKGGSTRAG